MFGFTRERFSSKAILDTQTMAKPNLFLTFMALIFARFNFFFSSKFDFPSRRAPFYASPINIRPEKNKKMFSFQ